VWLFAGNRNAPAEGGAGDAEIFQAAFDEADNFVFAAFGLDEIGILFVQIEERFLKSGELKK